MITAESGYDHVVKTINHSVEKGFRNIEEESLLRWMLGPREKINSQGFVLKIYHIILGYKLIIVS